MSYMNDLYDQMVEMYNSACIDVKRIEIEVLNGATYMNAHEMGSVELATATERMNGLHNAVVMHRERMFDDLRQERAERKACQLRIKQARQAYHRANEDVWLDQLGDGGRITMGGF